MLMESDDYLLIQNLVHAIMKTLKPDKITSFLIYGQGMHEKNKTEEFLQSSGCAHDDNCIVGY